MLNVSIEASGALARLEAMPQALHAALAAQADALRLQLQERVKDDKLSGQVLRARTGSLRDSIASDIVDENGGIAVIVRSSGALKYAAIQEFGGKTAAHDIIPSKAKVLAFVSGGGAQVFAKLVHHPGSTIPARPYLRSSLADMKSHIIESLNAAVVKALAT